MSKPPLRKFVDRSFVPLVSRVPALRRLFSYVGQQVGEDGYLSLRERFILNGRGAVVDVTARRDIVHRFERIDREVPSATSPTDGLILAEALLSMEGTGEWVECGCYRGASSCKLSIIAGLLGRKLLIFDSFEGLPGSDEAIPDYHVRRSSRTFSWKRGSYSARSVDLIRETIAEYGNFDCCLLHKGWFSETLNEITLPRRIAFAFVDVDLASSARDCLKAIWPRLVERGLFFSHDVAFAGVLQVFGDRDLWRNELDDFPPVLLGAGFGMSDASPHLGLLIKGTNIPPDYVNRISLNK